MSRRPQQFRGFTDLVPASDASIAKVRNIFTDAVTALDALQAQQRDDANRDLLVALRSDLDGTVAELRLQPSLPRFQVSPNPGPLLTLTWALVATSLSRWIF